MRYFWEDYKGTILTALGIVGFAGILTLIAALDNIPSPGHVTCRDAAGVVMFDAHVPNVRLHNVHGVTVTDEAGHTVRVSSRYCMVTSD
jgi:hypothetical protein